MIVIGGRHAKIDRLLKQHASAGGGTRTRTEFTLQGILSPLRLPFRHTGADARSSEVRNPYADLAVAVYPDEEKLQLKTPLCSTFRSERFLQSSC